MKSLKIRIAGDKKEVERLTEKLREWAKSWGNRKIFKLRRYDRMTGTTGSSIWKYHRTFGDRRFVNYIELKLPRIPDNLEGS